MESRNEDQGRTTAEQERYDAEQRAKGLTPEQLQQLGQGEATDGRQEPDPLPIGVGTRPAAQGTAIREPTQVESSADATSVTTDAGATRNVRQTSRTRGE